MSEDKIKSLAECKDQVAEKYGFTDYKSMQKSLIYHDNWSLLLSKIDEAAELYASDENRKKDEPTDQLLNLVEWIKKRATQISNSEGTETLWWVKTNPGPPVTSAELLKIYLKTE